MEIKSARLIAAIITIYTTGVSQPSEAVAWRWPYRCFFDRKSAALKPRCQQTVVEAIASWHREQEGRQYKSDLIDPKDPYAPPYKAHLYVVAYAPDAGTPSKADFLSSQRASAVASELQRLGVPEDFVEAIGDGDKIRFVPDAPLDPGNRFAEIVFR